MAKIEFGKHPQWTWYKNRFRRLATWHANWAIMGDRAYNVSDRSEVLGEMKGLSIYTPAEDN
ncbi:uncharacterized protein EAE98_012031 [Botrytis deweyae]|uniref:DDE Tnp4 domain-containing protein n=1 Tax=Botrytis deweyae TaxID=2478750 RepID=A0ABQ7I445_9HELO|nr:uncharacterized protein EAE98_012031 [Botrytis deweyae]KAF7910499.1 hypothetical protein EAE98_012031 [Botrytis deweyae]